MNDGPGRPRPVKIAFDSFASDPIPYVDTHKAEFVFRHKILRFLLDRGLITQERIDLLLSWRHSGFSVHNHTTVYPSDTEGLHPGPPKPWRRRQACLLFDALAGEPLPASLSSKLQAHPPIRQAVVPVDFSTCAKLVSPAKGHATHSQHQAG